MTATSSRTVVGIRRYPVKAMVGESLPRAALDGRGLVGDRALAVADGEGRFASLKDTRRFRRRDAVAGYRATTRDDGAVEVSHGTASWQVGDPALDQELGRACGTPVSVVAEAAVPHHDDGAVSLVGTASLRWCADRWGVDADPRRLRVNLLVETAEPFEEESWLGESLRVGGVTLRVVQRVERCRTIDVAQDGLAEGERWLKRLGAERDLRLAVYADVVDPGVIRLRDTVTRG
ncbi:MOSC domain-containing protein [Nocardioides coralli]|uniref:MOSC domain-containing protein n=1 Tax=Nocardioides coralli TaxID=2872154 RepID=UPI001CA3D380|nr:MOSC domain-containing protein [Nocardioides coralli]QZY30435.1 MOSC domain-containing protein [Nocardioides coralli]